MYVDCFIRQYVDIHKCTAAMLILVLGAVMSHAEQVGTDTYPHTADSCFMIVEGMFSFKT